MLLKYDARIKGEFKGWDGDSLFELTNGSKWKQKRDNYTHDYKFSPKAKIWSDGSRFYLEVDGMDEMVEVERQ